MKKILFITAFEPSSNSGGQIFSYNLLDELKENYSIDLICFSNEEITGSILPQFHFNKVIVKHVSFKKKIINSIFLPFLFPLFTGRFSWRFLFEIISLTKKNHYDLLYFDFSQTQLYSIFFPQKKKILMCHDIIFQKIKREKFMLKFFLPQVWLTEFLILKRKNNTIITLSGKDSLVLKKYYNLYSNFTTPFINKLVSTTPAPQMQKKEYFTMLGAWSRPENLEGLLWFLKNVCPLIPEINIKIMGSGLDKKIISKFKNIEYLGFVENPFIIIENSKALIAPIFKGAGVKIKVFDALSCGVPVIGNVLAFEGLNIGLKNYFYLFHDEKSAFVEINKIDKLITEDYIHLKREFYKFYGTPEILNIINRLVYS